MLAKSLFKNNTLFGRRPCTDCKLLHHCDERSPDGDLYQRTGMLWRLARPWSLRLQDASSPGPLTKLVQAKLVMLLVCLTCHCQEDAGREP